jgi:hypothetical protein
MSKGARIIAAAAVITMGASASLWADDRRPAITVMFRNDAAAPAEQVAAAQENVSAVYAAAGVDVTWNGRNPAAMLALIPGHEARRTGHRPEVIGFAIGGGTNRGKVAYIFMHRVKELSWRHRLPESVILGAAIAHELGHLLLPFESHSDTGVMRPILRAGDFKKADRGELLFTDGQAVQIREAIEARAGFER